MEQQLGGKPSAIQRQQLAKLYNSGKASSQSESAHIFSIDSNKRVHDLWNKLQEKSRDESQYAETNTSASRERLTFHEPYFGRRIPSEFIVREPVSKTLEDGLPMTTKPVDQKPLSDVVLHPSITDTSNATNRENRRDYHFNTTNPPQLHDLEQTSSFMNGRTVIARDGMETGLLTRQMAPDATEPQPSRASVDTGRNVPAANLTLEGRRQAQLAGEKFRARGLYSRPRKTTAGQGDRSIYHNRWASYKTNEIPKAFLSSPTPESKRQAQSVTDRLRSRTSRDRHGVKGFSDHPDTVGNNSDFGVVLEPSAQPSKLKETDRASSNGQKSLLEVFESEFAKHPRDSASQTNYSSNHPYRSSAPPKPIFADQKRPFASASPFAPSHPASTALEDGIQNALNGFETCLRGIVDTLKAAQPTKSNEEILGESMKTFRNLAETIAPLNAVPSESRVGTAISQVDLKSKIVPEDMKKFDSQFPVMTAYAPIIPHIRKPLGGNTRQNESDLPPDFISDFTGPFQYHRPGPIHLPQQHSPQKDRLSTQPGGAAPNSSGYVDHLRRSNSVNVPTNSFTAYRQQGPNPSCHANQNRSVSPLDITIRFPTIGQFENATFAHEFDPPAAPSLIDIDPEIGSDHPLRTKFGATADGTESSGQFFNRMASTRTTKQEAPPASNNEQSLNRSIGVGDGSVADKARLLRPFDAFAPEVPPRKQHVGGVHRSATVAACNLRRPYSENFSRNRHVGWDPLTTQQSNHGRHERADAEASSVSLPLPASSTTPQVKPVETSGIRRSNTDAGARREPNLRPRDIKVRKCVDSLIGLGFDLERSRLRVYASVADGDLDEAIDMLTEDQKMHEGRN